VSKGKRIGKKGKNGVDLNGAALITTVADKKSNYTVKDYNSAQLARKIQNMIGRHSYRDFLHIVERNQLINCPISRLDVVAAEDIFGANLGSLKGKTVRRSAPMVKTAAVNIPAEIQQRYHTVTIGMDIMFVKKVAFLITISHGIKFGTVEHIENRQHETILNAMKRLKKVYNLRGFQLLHCCADSEFEPLKTKMAGLGVDLNTASEDEHVPEIERYIRTVKEQTRSTYNMLPFRKLPSRMIIEIVKASVMWLNMFPAHDGISDTLSPRNIVTGQSVDYKRHCRIETGAYVQTHEEHDNSMCPRTIGAIALRPTGNAQGGYYFLSLSTGRRIHRQHFTELPMPDDVIDRVHQLARQSKAALGLTFGWRDGTEIDEQDDDSVADPNYDPADEPEEDLSDDEFDNESDNEDVAPPLAGVADQAIQNNNDNERDEQEEQEQDEQEPDNNQPEEADDIQHPDPAGVVSDHSESDDNDEDDQEDGDASEGDASSSDDEEQIDTSSVIDEGQADTAGVDAGTQEWTGLNRKSNCK